jgi:Cu-processing system ATP-binding protein
MIRLRGVRKRFGPIEVLRGIDLDIERGRVTAIVGPNGSGKSTLIRTVLGLVKPDNGQIFVDGELLNGDSGYRSRIGYMPQIVRFPENLSGRELIAMVTDLRPRKGAPDDELIEPFAVASELEKPLRVLSGGTRQKVNAIVAFRFAADVLILDEPTASLDPAAAIALKSKIRRSRAAGRTILLSSHVLGEVEALADDIVFLLDGRVEFAGPLERLRAETDQPNLEAAIAARMTGKAG